MLNRHSCVSLLLIGFIFSLVAPVQAQDIPNKLSKYDPSVCAADTKGKPLSAACEDMIRSFPRPDVTEITKDLQTLGAYSFWKVGPDVTNLYDAPNGSVAGQIPKGFNFV